MTARDKKVSASQGEKGGGGGTSIVGSWERSSSARFLSLSSCVLCSKVALLAASSLSAQVEQGNIDTTKATYMCVGLGVGDIKTAVRSGDDCSDGTHWHNTTAHTNCAIFA